MFGGIALDDVVFDEVPEFCVLFVFLGRVFLFGGVVSGASFESGIISSMRGLRNALGNFHALPLNSVSA